MTKMTQHFPKFPTFQLSMSIFEALMVSAIVGLGPSEANPDVELTLE